VPSAESVTAAGAPVRRALRGRLALAGAVALVTLLVGALRWNVEERHATVDVFYYAREALTIAGTPQPVADAEAAQFTFRMLRPHAVGTFAPEPLFISTDPRYQGTFWQRIVYPLVSAAGVPFVGVNALIVTAWLSAVVAALAVAFAVRMGTGSSFLGFLAALFLVVMPGGRYLYWTLAEAPMLAALAIALTAAGRYLLNGGRSTAVVALVALAVLAATKIGNFDVTVIEFVAVAVVAAVTRRSWWRRAATIAAASSGLAGLVLGFNAVLGLPSAVDQAQDFITNHFRRPDHRNPVRDLALYTWRFVREHIHELTGVPHILLTVGAGLGGLVLAGSAWVWPWLANAAGSVALVAYHPVRSPLDRLTAPLWLSVAVGAPVLLNQIWLRFQPVMRHRLAGGSM
jgi:hypothetical protein